ncbi:Crp/Fnr family transcriptional regulator [Saccharothrix sp. HUAS TT1]|uniref:Crp/Fnr family transcriptional regulator n=1 Tax=unclassified Saccharothrix TaxID=2593673 RepID=UPI00345B8180
MSTHGTEGGPGADASRAFPGRDAAGWSSDTFLGRLPASARSRLFATGHEVLFHPGHPLIREGEETTTVFVLVEGMAKVTITTSTGYTTLLAIRVAGDIVGELAPIDRAPRSASVVAALPTRALALTGEAFLRFLEENATASLELLRAMSQKLRSATNARSISGGYPVVSRLAQILRELGRSYGVAAPVGTEIIAPLSQSDLAALIGASEPAIHKALRDLRDRGAIRTGYRRIHIADDGILAEIADPDSA